MCGCFTKWNHMFTKWNHMFTCKYCYFLVLLIWSTICNNNHRLSLHKMKGIGGETCIVLFPTPTHTKPPPTTPFQPHPPPPPPPRGARRPLFFSFFGWVGGVRNVDCVVCAFIDLHHYKLSSTLAFLYKMLRNILCNKNWHLDICSFVSFMNFSPI